MKDHESETRERAVGVRVGKTKVGRKGMGGNVKRVIENKVMNVKSGWLRNFFH